jgi:hypothetical protein
MPKLTGPLFSCEAAGTLAKTLTYSRSKGQNLVREYAVPANPSTPAQVLQRQTFAAARIAESLTDKAIVNAWEIQRKLNPGISSANNYLGMFIDYAIAHPDWCLPSLQSPRVYWDSLSSMWFFQFDYETTENPQQLPNQANTPVTLLIDWEQPGNNPVPTQLVVNLNQGGGSSSNLIVAGMVANASVKINMWLGNGVIGNHQLISDWEAELILP